jgi:hypothetical protein
VNWFRLFGIIGFAWNVAVALLGIIGVLFFEKASIETFIWTILATCLAYLLAQDLWFRNWTLIGWLDEQCDKWFNIS